MDGSALEHSDSDSGESWTLLENTPTYADEAPKFADNSPKNGDTAGNIDKDEDTDGISIISDSDPESTTPCDINSDICLLEDGRPTEQHTPEYVAIDPIPITNINEEHESLKNDDEFLGDKCKLKTYVHRRNKRLSTVLNIIVLGSVITAAGVAIGHMWGARNECAVNTTPSVNKILSNLYKLQEENAYLRLKLKEITFINNIQTQRKIDAERTPGKQHRCRKVFEESLNNKNAEKLTKCVDNDGNAPKIFDNHFLEHEYEKEFLNDVDKLKNVYQQNKSWLDVEIARRLKQEEQSIKRSKSYLKSPKSIRVTEEQKVLKDESFKKVSDTSEPYVSAATVINLTELVKPVADPTKQNVGNSDALAKLEKKITYADSLKSDYKMNKKGESDNYDTEKIKKERFKKKKPMMDIDTISKNRASEEDIKKDDRYNEHKFKPERKKNDRHKDYNKKQKRKNKYEHYEQWETKGEFGNYFEELYSDPSHLHVFDVKTKINSPDKDKKYINRLSELERSMGIKEIGPSKDIDMKTKTNNPDNKDDKYSRLSELERSMGIKETGPSKDFDMETKINNSDNKDKKYVNRLSELERSMGIKATGPSKDFDMETKINNPDNKDKKYVNRLSELERSMGIKETGPSKDFDMETKINNPDNKDKKYFNRLSELEHSMGIKEIGPSKDFDMETEINNPDNKDKKYVNRLSELERSMGIKATGPSKDFDMETKINHPGNKDNKYNRLSELERSMGIKETDTTSRIDPKPKSDNRRSKRDRTNAKKDKDESWYEKRATLRKDARNKLEKELSGNSTPNNAGWYFRRMQKREQCRTKLDNKIHKKLSKRNMNFKTKT